MTATWRPDLVPDELVALTRSLGDPAKDLVILAEGNTSEGVSDGRIVVKASGVSMATATREDFVVVEVAEVMHLIASPTSSQAELTAVLDAGEYAGRRRRGSIETLIHAAVQAVKPSRFVAHTHPTDVVALLSSVHAEDAFDRAVYSDEAVVVGVPLTVPTRKPGLDLGRVFWERLNRYLDDRGELPSLILLGNHGIVSIADTADEAEAVSAHGSEEVRGVRLRACGAAGWCR